MKELIRASLALTLGLGTLSITVGAKAAPTFVRLSYTDNTQTTMTVSWNTTANATSEVQYGTASGSYTKTVTGTVIQANAGLGYIHEATVTGLSPSTKYFYIAGSTADGFSAESSFTTGPVEDPKCGSLKFAFLADNRPDPILGGGQNWPQIMGQAAAHQPAFMLNGGDLVVDGDKIDQWLALLGWTEPVAKSIPFMPAMGNHDTGPGSGDTANYNQIFALPRSTGPSSSGTEDYYYFTYANAIFVALSTESFKGGNIPFADQAAWLDQVLTNNPKKWKFVYYHKPTYTTEVLFSISHKPNEENQNAALVPIFDKHHVDVVMTSHNHWYERFEPSACGTQGKPGSATPCSVGAGNYSGGTVYLVSGGAGAFTIPAFLCGNTAGRAKCAGDHHYVLLDVQNETLKLETWGAYPQANQIIDTITIKKSADVCGSTPDGGTGGAAGSTGTGGGAGTTGSAGAGGGLGGGAGSGTGGASSGGASSGGASSGGSSGAATGGKPGSPSSSGDDSGCGCRTAGGPAGELSLLALLGSLVFLGRRRRRGCHAPLRVDVDSSEQRRVHRVDVLLSQLGNELRKLLGGAGSRKRDPVAHEIAFTGRCRTGVARLRAAFAPAVLEGLRLRRLGVGVGLDGILQSLHELVANASRSTRLGVQTLRVGLLGGQELGDQASANEARLHLFGRLAVALALELVQVTEQSLELAPVDGTRTDADHDRIERARVQLRKRDLRLRRRLADELRWREVRRGGAAQTRQYERSGGEPAPLHAAGNRNAKRVRPRPFVRAAACESRRNRPGIRPSPRRCRRIASAARGALARGSAPVRPGCRTPSPRPAKSRRGWISGSRSGGASGGASPNGSRPRAERGCASGDAALRSRRRSARSRARTTTRGEGRRGASRPYPAPGRTPPPS
jgi:hypothetical protein